MNAPEHGPGTDMSPDRGNPGDILIRYARAVDARDWRALEQCFSPHATVQGTLQASEIAPYLEFLKASLDAYSSTMHVMANQHIEWQSDTDRASVETYALAYHVAKDAVDRAPTLTMGVVYHDEMVHEVPGGWRILHRRVTPRWIEGQLPS
jgi:3-phenylpropionate/cinnamic acid dioxygenase small subunit